MKKTLGISIVFALVCVLAAVLSEAFLTQRNLEELLLRVGLYGILAVGVAFVIVTGGIDLSIGTVVCLTGCGLPWLVVRHDWSAGTAVLVLVGVSVVIGLWHGWLVTKLRLQPFVVTLCGLLIYRGLMRGVTDDQGQGFGTAHADLRWWATGEVGIGWVLFAVGLVLAGVAWVGWREGRSEGGARRSKWLVPGVAGGVALFLGGIWWRSDWGVRMPFVILLGVSALAALFFARTVWGRHLLALGNNEEAARFSGIATDRLVILSYVVCSLLAGVGGMLFVLDVNSAQSSDFGSFYELYAIAAAVIGGCSLRGGRAAVFGVLVGAALMQVLRNLIVLAVPKYQNLEFAVIGVVILLGVAADEVLRRWWSGRAKAA